MNMQLIVKVECFVTTTTFNRKRKSNEMNDDYVIFVVVKIVVQIVIIEILRIKDVLIVVKIFRKRLFNDFIFVVFVDDVNFAFLTKMYSQYDIGWQLKCSLWHVVV